MPGVLVACVGNIFLSDDGFGVEVAAALAAAPVPDGVKVVDFGIRSVHLVYELLERVRRPGGRRHGRPAGGPARLALRHRAGPAAAGRHAPTPLPEVMLDPHDLSPGGVMSLVPTLGGAGGPDPRRRLPAGGPRRRHRALGRRGRPPSSRRPTWCATSSAASSTACAPTLRSREEVDEVKKLLTLLVGAAVAAVAVVSLPDIKRYLEMRRM